MQEQHLNNPKLSISAEAEEEANTIQASIMQRLSDLEEAEKERSLTAEEIRECNDLKVNIEKMIGKKENQANQPINSSIPAQTTTNTLYKEPEVDRIDATVPNGTQVTQTLQKTNMFSKLEFTVGDNKIEFHLHEVVKIALQIIENKSGELIEEKVLIPFHGIYDQFLDSLLRKEITTDKNIISGELDKYLFVPIHLHNINTIGKWLFVTRILKNTYQNELLRGWWINIANRLLLIKNDYYGYNFRISLGNKETIINTKKKLKKTKNLKENFLLYKKPNNDKWFVFGKDYKNECGDYDITDLVNKELKEKLSLENIEKYKEELWKGIVSENYFKRSELIENNYYSYNLYTISGNEKIINGRKNKLKSEENANENFLLYSNPKDNRWFIFGKNCNDAWEGHDITNLVNKLPDRFSREHIEKYEEEILEGILSKLDHSQRFYVSDHGFIFDIIQQMKEIALELPWVILWKPILDLINDIESRSPQEAEKIKKQFAESIVNDSLEELKELQADKTEEELKEIQEKFATDSEYQKLDWQRSTAMFDYLKVLIEKFIELNLAIPDVFEKIFDDYEEDTESAERIIKTLVLAILAKEINKGKHEPLVRPIYAYGHKDKGDTYHAFETALKNYFEQKDSLPPDELAKIMRNILKGGVINDDKLAFLPNLVGAWFVAESVRNPVSLLSGLILIDILEENIKLKDESGNNWYTWQHTLIHPQKSLGAKKVKDLYGHTIDRVDQFGGCHPMVHNGSVNEAKKTLTPKEKLPVVRQKEGSLILHWLYEIVKNQKLDYICEIFTTENSRPPLNPEYNEIAEPGKNSEALEEILKKINNPKQKSKIGANNLEKYRLEIKQKIQKEVIEPYLKLRLSSLDNLLFLSRIKKLNTEGTELEIPRDGSCLFWSVALGILTPVLDNPLAYHNAFHQLFVLDTEDTQLFDQYGEGLKERIKAFLNNNDTSLIEQQGKNDHFYKLINYHFRQKVANYINLHSERYTVAVLGREDYITAIRNSNFWGGQIEIDAIFRMLDENYQIEVEGITNSDFIAPGKPVIRLVYTNAGGDHAGHQNHYNLRMFPIKPTVNISPQNNSNSESSSAMPTSQTTLSSSTSQHEAEKIIATQSEAIIGSSVQRQKSNLSPSRYSAGFRYSGETQVVTSNTQVSSDEPDKLEAIRKER